MQEIPRMFIEEVLESKTVATELAKMNPKALLCLVPGKTGKEIIDNVGKSQGRFTRALFDPSHHEGLSCF